MILKQEIFREKFSLDNKKRGNLLVETICKRKGKLSSKEWNELRQDHFWNKIKNESSLFLSRNYFSKNGILVDLLEEKTPIFPPVPNQWLIDNDLDYSNPNLLSEDSDGDGFTNLEEWQGSDPYQSPGSHPSDPNNPRLHPPLWTKLRWNSESLHKNNYYFDFMGSNNNNAEEYFQLQSQNPIPDINAQGKNILSTKIREVKLGEKIANLPLCVFSYEEKKVIYKEICYDVSELTLKNLITEEYWKLIRKSTLHPQSTAISIIDGISFDYILKSPPQKIDIQCGSSFELESLPFYEETESAGKKDTEVYHLVKLNSKEATLEKEGQYYCVPISIN